MSTDSHSEPFGVVLAGRAWVGEECVPVYTNVILRVDDDDDDQPDTLDLRLDLGEPGELLLNVPRVDMLRALQTLGTERERHS